MKKLILYGAGEIGNIWMERLGSDKVFAFADSSEKKVGSLVAGKKVLSVQELKEMKEEIAILISTGENIIEQIAETLKQNGLEEQIVKTPYLEGENVLDASSHLFNTVLEGHNYVGENTCIRNSQLGFASYIAANSQIDDTLIGKFSAIGQNVKIIRGQHPTSKFVSIHPAFYSVDNVIQYSFVKQNKYEEFKCAESNYAVVIGSDVWIGTDVSIMEGVTIADGSIIAAGTVVVKDTEPYSITGGVPGRLLKYRFEKEIIKELCKFQWWNKDIKWIKEHAEMFEDINKFLSIGREK